MKMRLPNVSLSVGEIAHIEFLATMPAEQRMRMDVFGLSDEPVEEIQPALSPLWTPRPRRRTRIDPPIFHYDRVLSTSRDYLADTVRRQPKIYPAGFQVPKEPDSFNEMMGVDVRGHKDILFYVDHPSLGDNIISFLSYLAYLHEVNPGARIKLVTPMSRIVQPQPWLEVHRGFTQDILDAFETFPLDNIPAFYRMARERYDVLNNLIGDDTFVIAMSTEKVIKDIVDETLQRRLTSDL